MDQKKQKLKERQEESNKRKYEKRKSNFELKKQASLLPNLKENQGFDLGDPSKRASIVFEISKVIM